MVFLSLSTYHLLVPLHWECIEGKVSSNRRARRDTNQINAKCSGHRECVKSVTMTGWVLGIIWVFGAFDTRFQRRQHQQHCYHKHYSLLADHSKLARQVHSCLESAVFVVLLFVLFVHREDSFLQHPTATLTDWLELFVVMGHCCRLSEVNMASAGNSNHLNFINSDCNEYKHDKKCFLELLCAACVCLCSMSVLQSCNYIGTFTALQKNRLWQTRTLHRFSRGFQSGFSPQSQRWCAEPNPREIQGVQRKQ